MRVPHPLPLLPIATDCCPGSPVFPPVLFPALFLRALSERDPYREGSAPFSVACCVQKPPLCAFCVGFVHRGLTTPVAATSPLSPAAPHSPQRTPGHMEAPAMPQGRGALGAASRVHKKKAPESQDAGPLPGHFRFAGYSGLTVGSQKPTSRYPSELGECIGDLSLIENEDR